MFDDHVIWIKNPQKEIYLFMGHPVQVSLRQYANIVQTPFIHPTNTLKKASGCNEDISYWGKNMEGKDNDLLVGCFENTGCPAKLYTLLLFEFLGFQGV